jgi:hypothetical protein
MVNPTGKDEYYMDEFLRNNLDTAKHVIKKDWDFVIILDGGEREGKSVLGMQVAQYLDENFNLNKIAFTSEDFKRLVLNANKYEAIIYDEGYTGLNSKNTMSIVTKSLIQMFAEIGQKNLFIIVIVPTFFDLTRYIAIWRSRMLIHVYTGDSFNRGFFGFYNIERKKMVYIMGKKYYIYRFNEREAKPNFTGRYTNHYVLDEAAYRKLKNESLKNYDKIKENLVSTKQLNQEIFNRLQAISDKELTHSLRIKILDIPRATYYHWLKTFNEQKDGEKITNEQFETLSLENEV